MGRGRSNARRNNKNKKNVTPTTPDTPEPKPRENFGVMSTPGGTKYMVVDVAGGDRCCGLLAPIALNLFAAGIPVEDIVSSVKDNITDDMKEYVQTLRGKVVKNSGERFTFADGEEFADFADVVGNPNWVKS